MKKRRLGSDGPVVSAIGLGCMSFGGTFGPTTFDDSLRCLDAARDHGLDFLDTANFYGMGVSETVIGEWLHRRKHRVTIATKAAIVDGPPRRSDTAAPYLRAEPEAALRRLKVDHIALFYLHRREEGRPIEAVVGTVSRLIDAGLIGGYGLSEVSPGTLRRAHAVRRCTAVQNEYSLWTRLPELGLIQTCAELGTAFVAFSALARGAPGRRVIDPATFAPSDFRRSIPRFQGMDWQLNQERIKAFAAFAASRGYTTPALALAWVLAQGDQIIPIPGTRSSGHLTDWVGASDMVLTAADRSELARLLPVGWACGDRCGLDQAVTVEPYC